MDLVLSYKAKVITTKMLPTKPMMQINEYATGRNAFVKFLTSSLEQGCVIREA